MPNYAAGRVNTGYYRERLRIYLKDAFGALLSRSRDAYYLRRLKCFGRLPFVGLLPGGGAYPGPRIGCWTMVDVAQLVEPRIVIPAVAGSSPVVHPIS